MLTPHSLSATCLASRPGCQKHLKGMHRARHPLSVPLYPYDQTLSFVGGAVCCPRLPSPWGGRVHSHGPKGTGEELRESVHAPDPGSRDPHFLAAPFLLLPASGLQWRQAAGGTASTQDHRATAMSAKAQSGKAQSLHSSKRLRATTPARLLVTQDTQAPYLSKSLCMAFFRHFAVNSIYPKPNSRFPLKLVPCQPLHICKPEIRSIMNSSGSPGGASGRELGCQCRRHKRLQSLGWEDPLKEGMATHCSILAW